MAKKAILAGASGLVGRELLRLLLESSDYAAVHSLVRRVTPDTPKSPKLSEQLVDFERLPALAACDDVYVALGTTIKVAGSPEAFRKVDHDYVVAVARAGRAAGAERLAVVSALGADPMSRVFYNRVKGEMQEAVAALGYGSVVIVQPSLLLGDREALGQAKRAGEVWARRLLEPVAGLIPSGFRPVRASDVAAVLVSAMLTAAPGTRIIASRELHGSSGRVS